MTVEYSVRRRIEEVPNPEDRSLYRVVLEASDDSSSIIGTFEAFRELHDRVRCVQPLSFVDESTHEPVQVTRNTREVALTKVIDRMVEEDNDLAAW